MLTPELEAIIRCPRCGAPLQGLDGPAPRCANAACIYAIEGFPTASGQPVLIDFGNSIFERTAYEDGRGSVQARDDRGTTIASRLRRLLFGENRLAAEKASDLLRLLETRGSRQRVLVIGGGALGSGMEPLYESNAIEMVGTDVYASPFTKLIADGHRLPFEAESFDAVWIQAVLEHVLTPSVVVDEIFRVLRPGGFVFADSPFLFPVHEGAYDFMRFTLSGHRWLFRHFEQIEAGTSSGAGTAALLSIRYLLRALGLGNKGASLLTLPLFWLRFLDGAARKRENADAAAGVYFLGRKSEKSLDPKDMVAYYERQQDKQP